MVKYCNQCHRYWEEFPFAYYSKEWNWDFVREEICPRCKSKTEHEHDV